MVVVMAKRQTFHIYILLVFTLLSEVVGIHAKENESRISVSEGAINSVVFKSGGAHLVVYGVEKEIDGGAELVLLSHHRRDVLWAARDLIDGGADAVAPKAEQSLIESPETFWTEFQEKRFHDYAQQTTKVLAKALPVAKWVEEGDVVEWNGLSFEVLDTPGFTRGSVSYVVNVADQTIGFTGDLIYGDGQFFDLYSFQDAIPDANVGGYHGYGGRLGQLVQSLEKIKALDLDMIIPLRGPVIKRPNESIDKLLTRVKSLYDSYLSTQALHWYFGEERLTICKSRVLGEKPPLRTMGLALHEDTPEWIWVKSTSRLVIADNGHAFLMDCGSQAVIDGINELIEMGVVKQVDGIFVTHYHDDHTNLVQAASEEFDCPVYATKTYSDILENPGNYHMPCLHHVPIKDVTAFDDGFVMKWHEFKLSFFDFPGQTFYHGALKVERHNETPVFFIGDAFSPSGMDDYCVLNRNLLHEDDGLLYCMRKVRELGADYWLINEHIPHVFRFTGEELDYLEGGFKERVKVLSDLTPFDDPNYAVDEQWAFFYPYASEIQKSDVVELEFRIINHSKQKRTYKITPRLPDGAKLLSKLPSITLKGRTEGVITLKVQVPDDVGVHLVRADVQSQGIDLRDWVEAMLIVK